MVRRLLTVDPAQRMGWDELNAHPWVNGAAGERCGAPQRVRQQLGFVGEARPPFSRCIRAVQRPLRG